MSRLDWALTHDANHLLARHDGLEDAIGTYEHLGAALFVLVLLALLAAGGSRLRRAAVSAAAATGVALLAAQVIAHLVDRPRPFVAHAGAVHLFAAHSADAGFPSDHSTAAFAIAGAVLVHDRRWGAVLLALATLLAAGRVGLGVHYPSDVLAGAVLGAAAAALVTRRALRRRLDALADRLTDRPAFRRAV